MKVYVASSWRNPHQRRVVELLRGLGHEVYDFRDQETAFGWAEVLPSWPGLPSPAELREGLRQDVAARGHEADRAALDGCDACVLVLPAGSSSHWELGYAVGRGSGAYVYAPGELVEPELVYSGAAILATERELLDAFTPCVPGTCCSCGYTGEEETTCPRAVDGQHCEHWWDGTEEQAEAEERKFNVEDRRPS